MILRARFIYPGTGPIIEEGIVEVEKSRIQRVGQTVEGGDELLELDDAILLPGLINAHCHLELSDLAGEIPPRDGFTRWLQKIVARKHGREHSDYERAALDGAEMLLRSGTTSVCDIVSWWPVLPKLHATKLRSWSCLEMIDFAGQRSWREWVSSAEQWFEKLQNPRGGWGLSPHAPYTATADLYRAALDLERRTKTMPLVLTTHICESKDEREMFEEGGGKMYEWLVRLGRDMYDCGGQSSLELLARNKLLTPRTLGVHLNGLDQAEIELVARCGMSVAHCPGSHEFFGHPPFPMEQLLARGVNVCVGTDSLASAPRGATLDLFAELRRLRRAYPGLSAETILRLATVNGARALQAESRLGTLEPGKCADLIALQLPAGTKRSDVLELVVTEPRPLALVMVNGEQIRR